MSIYLSSYHSFLKKREKIRLTQTMPNCYFKSIKHITKAEIIFYKNRLQKTMYFAGVSLQASHQCSRRRFTTRHTMWETAVPCLCAWWPIPLPLSHGKLVNRWLLSDLLAHVQLENRLNGILLQCTNALIYVSLHWSVSTLHDFQNYLS